MGIRPVYMQSGDYRDEDLGTIRLRVLSTAVRFTARWKGDVLHLTVPPRCTAADVVAALRSMKPRLLARRPSAEAFYKVGFRFDSDLVSLLIECNPNATRPLQLLKGREGDYSFVFVCRSEAELSDKRRQTGLARSVALIARHVAETRVLPEARRIIGELGMSRRVRSLSVGRGMRRLGTCDARGNITLSHTLAFMSPRIRYLVLTHELSHLDHMDHSPAFYVTWQSYNRTPVRELRRLVSRQPLPLPQ